MTSVRTGIDLERYRPLDQAGVRRKLHIANRPTLGILATLRDWKGHQFLLDAMAALRKDFPAWQLIIIGDGPQREALEARVEELRLGGEVTFAGNQDNVPEWLSALDIFTLPSYGDEGVPQGIMQAMACGLPVVSTPVGAIGEAVQDGLTGLMTEPRNAAALAASLAQMMADNELRQRMGAASLAYARANFGIDIMLDQMLAVFRRFAKRP